MISTTQTLIISLFIATLMVTLSISPTASRQDIISGEGTHQQQDFHNSKFDELMAWSPNNCLTHQKYASAGLAANWQK